MRGPDRPDRRALPAIKKFDIATQGNRSEAIFGFILTSDPGRYGLTKADGKSQHFHARPATDNIVSVLVHGDQDADRDDECQQACQNITHRRSIPLKFSSKC